MLQVFKNHHLCHTTHREALASVRDLLAEGSAVALEHLASRWCRGVAAAGPLSGRLLRQFLQNKAGPEASLWLP
jgi:hypothetical protein